MLCKEQLDDAVSIPSEIEYNNYIVGVTTICFRWLHKKQYVSKKDKRDEHCCRNSTLNELNDYTYNGFNVERRRRLYFIFNSASILNALQSVGFQNSKTKYTQNIIIVVSTLLNQSKSIGESSFASDVQSNLVKCTFPLSAQLG
ncbi:hypothetical protein T01_6138 [Trichinella spiralis]|uniref:Uncharacterized protein n=1 Tax=Trichinella spiralis TaxID=6334 RepID=A0A0V1C0B5_TRISP|nr:hypothetical protein T01_6138 [Trichinella spiralis]